MGAPVASPRARRSPLASAGRRFRDSTPARLVFLRLPSLTCFASIHRSLARSRAPGLCPPDEKTPSCGSLDREHGSPKATAAARRVATTQPPTASSAPIVEHQTPSITYRCPAHQAPKSHLPGTQSNTRHATLLDTPEASRPNGSAPRKARAIVSSSKLDVFTALRQSRKNAAAKPLHACHIGIPHPSACLSQK